MQEFFFEVGAIVDNVKQMVSRICNPLFFVAICNVLQKLRLMESVRQRNISEYLKECTRIYILLFDIIFDSHEKECGSA